MSYKCEILADSKSPQGNRLTTMKVTFPRFILAEFNTHRMFSRNSASSRAIPFKKMVKMVEENPFVPIAWQKDHAGMQGSEYFTDEKRISYNELEWLIARDKALKQASELNNLGVTKQLCNRLLEPFMWHTVIVTATEWENFFKLRCPQYYWHSGEEAKTCRSWKDAYKEFEFLESVSILEKLSNNKSQAEIHIQAIAELMWDAYKESIPKQLEAGEWHIPFGDNIQPGVFGYAKEFSLGKYQSAEEGVQMYKVKIATARCARISYETLGDNPKIDYEADLKLYDILKSSGHFSPFEHVARVMNKDEFNSRLYQSHGEHGWCRNFRGFIQQRALID